MEDGPASRSNIQSLDVTLDIIEHLATVDRAGVTELADAAGVTKSTAHAHLSTLANRSYVVNEAGQYKLGMRFLRLGRTLQQNEPLYSIAKDEVDELIDEIGERAQVMVREGNAGAHVYRTTGDRAITTDSDVGTNVHLHATASGKAYLSCMADDEVERIVDATGLPKLTDATITDRDELFAELDRVRERGYALNMEENFQGLRAVGAPIRNTNTGEVLGALSVSGPTTRFTDDYIENELAEKVKNVAQVLSVKATYSRT